MVDLHITDLIHTKLIGKHGYENHRLSQYHIFQIGSILIRKRMTSNPMTQPVALNTPVPVLTM